MNTPTLLPPVRKWFACGLFLVLALTAPQGTWAAETAAPRGQPRVEAENFGTLPDGTTVKRFTLRNRSGALVRVITYGAIITEIRVPDRTGAMANVVLGSDALEPYVKGHPAAAAVIGRFANRIAKARFTIDGVEYRLAANNGPNHIHGGAKNFSRVVWDAQPLSSGPNSAAVRLSYLSKDGEEGYPGNLRITVTYSWTEKNELGIQYEATTDKPTVINFTNHAYFNLAGEGDSLGHVLWLAADRYTPADDQLIPTGEIASVKGTPLDFTTPTPIGARIAQLKPRMNGYDHNYVLPRGNEALARCARVLEPNSGRAMEVSTTEPGVQLYTGNHLREFVGTGGAKFGAHGGLCLETQHFPDTPNKPNFPGTLLRPGETFRSKTVFAFSVR